jgi:hypothetical protein
MTPDFETIKKLWATSRDLTISDRIAEKASEELEGLLPDDLWDEMVEFPTDSPEFENAFRKYYAKTKTPVETRTVKSRRKADTPKRRGLFNQPRRVSRAVETWRCLSNYPNYEISSHGRVRAIDRARPNDWLKPRRKWYKGMCPDSVVLKDRDGRRREIFVGKLLVAAGFMEMPKFMKSTV